ncbi:MAG: sulfatase activating formylglycine-generating enzyme [Alphaproteobacteria bacterium]|jgi:formylglycine-generating enzyme required for sulfatase activity
MGIAPSFCLIAPECLIKPMNLLRTLHVLKITAAIGMAFALVLVMTFVVPVGSGWAVEGRAGAAIDVPPVIQIPAGPFIAGSDRAEREAAYRLDEAAYGHTVTRRDRWYEDEPVRTRRHAGAYAITRTTITNRQYAAFVAATGHPAPDIDAQTWAGYGLIHPYARTRRHVWIGGHPPEGRVDHPVVLVSYDDARAYAAWLTHITGQRWHLPSEDQWEKAARGPMGARFPWGDMFDPGRLNSHDAGPFDTLPVGHFPTGASPFGLLDAAGQVFEWTRTPAGREGFIVKGGSWDDKGCGICRPAARHGRPQGLKHILVGFRLVREDTDG